MKTYLLDTNAILRFFLNDLPIQHEETKRLLKSAKEGKVKVYTAEVTIFEVYFTLNSYYNLSKELIVRHLCILLKSSYVNAESKELFLEAFDLHIRLTGLSFVDCFLLAKARETKMEIFTFDKNLQKQLQRV